MSKIEAWLRWCFRWHSIEDGTTCEVTRTIGAEAHDYYEHYGGDGHPSHFHEYVCPACGHAFGI